MNSPYKKRLEDLMGQNVVVYRADTSDVYGKLSEVDEDGCVVNNPNASSPGTVLAIFVAYEDIRGVGHEIPDYDNI
ncbi:MAG: hypothetical protein Q7S43_04200 [bacterium]|nr:hypothetical protein [bacterium]